MNLKKFLLVVIAAVTILTSQAQNRVPVFKKGERAAFVGNSITHGGYYHSYIWLYYMTRFPDMPITIMNVGVGGDCAWSMEDRMIYDIFPKKPTYLALTFGMNDTGYYDFYKENAQQLAENNIKRSYESFKRIEKVLLEDKGLIKVLIGSSPYDETAKLKSEIFPKKNEAMQKVVDFQRKAAQENGWGLVDFSRPMMDINQREQAKDSTFSICGDGRIHPDNDGHMVMAYLFLKAQGMANKKVAEVSIDAKKQKLETAENCEVSQLESDGNMLAFNYLAKALPYPLDTISRGWGNRKSQADALKVIPFMKEFDQELLKVSGLQQGYYQLKIDGQLISTFSSDDLQNGINLAKFPNTPQYRQASSIMYLNDERFEIEKRLRDYAWMEFSFLKGKGLLFADNQASIDTIRANWDNPFIRGNFGVYEKAQYPEIREVWQEQMDDIIRKIYEIAQPVNHLIKLSRTN